MKYREYGEAGKKTVILLHGGGLSWWNYREEAERLQDEYRVILPVLDGHAGSDRPFTSIEDNAAEIIAFIDAHCGGSVKMIGGLSLGAQVLAEMLCQRGDICRYALIESAALIPAKWTNAMVGPAFSGSYGLIRNRGFAKMQFRSLHIKPELFEDYYRDTCAIAKPDMIAFMKANTAYELKPSFSGVSAAVYAYAGGRETGQILRSLDVMKKALPSCTVQILDGLYHGEFSLNHADEYVRTVKEILCGGNGNG